MSATERPLSPHLQVYRLPFTAILSILHRLTGIALYGGTFVWVWWLAGAGLDGDLFDAAAWFLGSWLGYIILIGWTFALFLHLGNGIRHLFWDVGRGYELKTADASGWLVVLAAAGLTVATWIAAFIVMAD